MEVRQALALIKERVNEIKDDDQWKEKLEREAERDRRIDEIRAERRAEEGSVAGSEYSQKSLKEEVREKLEAEDQERGKPEWDASTQGGEDRNNPEDRLARRLAKEVLEKNPVSKTFF